MNFRWVLFCQSFYIARAQNVSNATEASLGPTTLPTNVPTVGGPTFSTAPTGAPTEAPTGAQTGAPSSPTSNSSAPTSSAPSPAPSAAPSVAPTSDPTVNSTNCTTCAVLEPPQAAHDRTEDDNHVHGKDGAKIILLSFVVIVCCAGAVALWTSGFIERRKYNSLNAYGDFELTSTNHIDTRVDQHGRTVVVGDEV